VSPTGTKGPCPPADPASRWTRDKNHLLSRAQRLPGQMAWNKCLFCSSVPTPIMHYLEQHQQRAVSCELSRNEHASLLQLPSHWLVQLVWIDRIGGRELYIE